MIEIVTTPDEINAALIVQVLQNEGIQASYGHNTSHRGRIPSCTVYCVENKKEEAIKLLKDKDLIK